MISTVTKACLILTLSLLFSIANAKVRGKLNLIDIYHAKATEEISKLEQHGRSLTRGTKAHRQWEVNLKAKQAYLHSTRYLDLGMPEEDFKTLTDYQRKLLEIEETLHDVNDMTKVHEIRHKIVDVQGKINSIIHPFTRDPSRNGYLPNDPRREQDEVDQRIGWLHREIAPHLSEEATGQVRALRLKIGATSDIPKRRALEKELEKLYHAHFRNQNSGDQRAESNELQERIRSRANSIEERIAEERNPEEIRRLQGQLSDLEDLPS